MPATLRREDRGRLVLAISGQLRKAELDDAQRQMLGLMRQDGTGAVRLLVLLDAFEGWERDARWNDLSFFVSHGDALERVAIVGEERWRDHALMFAAADLRKGPVEYFTPAEIAGARAWLAG